MVQKFGGTSVATPEQRDRVVQRVVEAHRKGYAVAVVVSAWGRRGDPYATDTLLSLTQSGEVSDRDRDLLLTCGEIISAVVLSGLLNARGVMATALTGAGAGIITDGAFGEARILEVQAGRVLGILGNGGVAVVAGFQGVTRDGEVTTLGRGGSDTSAAALGVALGAELVEIYTDVEGIMTADPRLIPGTRLLPQVSYAEVAEMAHLGAKVIHPRAVEIAAAGRVPLRIKSTLSEAEGTLIGDRPPSGVEIRGDRVVTGIAHVTGLAQLRVRGREAEDLSNRQVELFAALAEEEISVDLINVSPEQVSLAVPEEKLARGKERLERQGFVVETRPHLAKVSAVGGGMRGVPGVMARVVTALRGAAVTIYQTADSHTNISCLVAEADLIKAAAALHQEFRLDETPGGAL